MTRISTTRAGSFCLLFAVLTLGACTYHKPKNRTVLIIDSTYVAAFERNQLRMKYMSDEGAPNVIPIVAGLGKIILTTGRENIELAFQNNNTVTQYFFINQGDSALLTEFEDNIGVNILNRPCPLFDENYKTKYKAFLHGDITGADEFYSACALMNDTQSFDWNHDADLNEHLLKLKKWALEAILRENRFIDSLTTHDLISTDVAGFYKVKNTFDSIKISHYQGSRPNNGMHTFLRPFKAFSQVPPGATLSWTHLTFYDDWLDMYINQLSPKSSAYQIPPRADDSLRMMILRLDLKDSAIKNMLLLKVSSSGAQKTER